MKTSYLFVLGRDPELSRIEIESYFDSRNIKVEIIDESSDILVINIEKLDPEVINELGGTIKIAEVISNSDNYYDIEDSLTKANIYPGIKNKVNYAIEPFKTKLFSTVSDYLKDYFKKEKIKASFKRNLDPSSLSKKDFINDMINFIIFKNFIGIVRYVSDPKEFKRRDLGRPDVDYMKSISIRLAKIMVNISKVKSGQILIDPFCGSGTVLQEALLKNINVIGIDDDSNSIKQSKTNLEWLKNNYNINSNYQLIKLDARKMFSVIKKGNVIVTEPYMGPFIRKLPRLEEAQHLVRDLRELYDSIVRQAKEILNKDERIVIIIPIIRTLENKNIKIDFINIASAYGFTVIYKPVFYAYKGSKLHREIYVLEKN